MNEQAIIFDRENTPNETMPISGVSVTRISKAMEAIKRGEKPNWAHIYGYKDLYCENCDEEITGLPIEIEVEMTVREVDGPVLRHVCSEQCKNEFEK